MKRLLIVLIVSNNFAWGQVINVDVSGAAGSESITVANTTLPGAVNSIPVGSVTVNMTNCPAGVTPIFKLTKDGVEIGTPLQPAVGGVWTNVYPPGLFTGLTNRNIINLTVTCGAASISYPNIFQATLPAPAVVNTGKNAYEIVNGSPAAITDPILMDAQSHLIYTYDRRRNRVFIVIGPDGQLLSRKPVNIDEDDEFTIYLIGLTSELPNFNITSNGVYNPSDLSQTNNPNPTGFGAQSSGPVAQWAAREFHFGPYTNTENGVTFHVTKTTPLAASASPVVTNITSMTFMINKFYHVDYAVSVISTDLASPDYKVFPLENGTDNTIIAVDDGKRTMITFGVIWYWKSTLNKLFKKSHRNDYITRGRDRIKEPLFWDRINPTFGLSIDQGFRQNYFAGGVFEFARGGNITMGGHWGKYNTLANTKFKLGETVYTGTNDDIVINPQWKWGFYFGITLDTRIFNRITSALGNQP